MKTVKDGTKIQILYEARLEDGTLCYKNEKDTPLELIIGEGKFFPAIEKELKKMKEGEKKTMTLKPEEAFGPHMDELVMDVPKDVFGDDAVLEVGSRIKINTPSGKQFYGTISAIGENSLTIDLNHPLAGKKIVFDITLVAIE